MQNFLLGRSSGHHYGFTWSSRRLLSARSRTGASSYAYAPMGHPANSKLLFGQLSIDLRSEARERIRSWGKLIIKFTCIDLRVSFGRAYYSSCARWVGLRCLVHGHILAWVYAEPRKRALLICPYPPSVDFDEKWGGGQESRCSSCHAQPMSSFTPCSGLAMTALAAVRNRAERPSRHRLTFGVHFGSPFAG